MEPEKFFEKFEQIGKYIPKLPYYNTVQSRELYNWLQVVVERFNFQKLENALDRDLYNRYKVFLYKSIPINRGTAIIEKIIAKIESEGSGFLIGVAEEFK